MSLLESTLHLLADGKPHSDQEISTLLGIPNKQVSDIIKRIVDLSVDVERVNDKNYRILGGLELLDASYIRKELVSANPLLAKLEILGIVDSTNNYLLNKTEYNANYAVFAEQQTAGRGQFQRIWYSTFGKDITLSLLWQLSSPSNKLSGLSLVVGIAVVKALEAYGLKKIQLKWPNDIIHEGKKLGGILIESRSIDAKIQKVVIGIGLNLYNPSRYPHINNHATTSIFSLQNLPPRRNQLAALILKSLLRTLIELENKDLDHFMQDWQQRDYLAGKLITVQNQANFIVGIGAGINTRGQLCVKIKNKSHYFNSGEIRVKLKTDK